jgi:hypothetical protein
LVGFGGHNSAALYTAPVALSAGHRFDGTMTDSETGSDRQID